MRDEDALMWRLARVRRGDPVHEVEEYVLGTVCAAVPVTVGGVVASVGFSLPLAGLDRLRPTAVRLRDRLERALVTQAFTLLP
ncbi:hypothetical protein AB4225_25660 [Streptomyces sp. 2RAF24]|uniref:hypothetical protein n=1 Tax=unclassified Streptomyces TaxID=2593676 RepID=UPI0033C4357B